MNLTFLGTSAMVPTKERNLQSIYLEVNGEGILLDCGEGTQRQMQLAKLSFSKIKKILISHWHGDHVLGLPGLFQTISSFTDDERSVKLFGPIGTKKYIENMLKSCVFDNPINLEIVELDSEELKTFYQNEDYKLEFINLEHSVPTIGFRFTKKSKFKINKTKIKSLGIPDGPLLKELQQGNSISFEGKEIKVDDLTTKTKENSVAFIFDTKLCDGCYALAKDSKYLISEAVYAKGMEDKAEQYSHLTSDQVAQVASVSGVEKLFLTHFSQRYKTTEQLEKDAKDIFPETICAYDLMKVKLNL